MASIMAQDPRMATTRLAGTSFIGLFGRQNILWAATFLSLRQLYTLASVMAAICIIQLILLFSFVS